MNYRAILLCLFLGVFAGCADEQATPVPGTSGPGANNPNNPGNGNPAWLIPSDQVFDGGPGKDGIPSIDAPAFSGVNQINFLEPNDLVLGLRVGDEIRAYPHPILDWHEIVNDEIGQLPLAITYCPLTGTGIGWHREVNGQVTTFGVSGLLYNTNLIPYDRHSDSNWSQMLLKSVNGTASGTEVETYPLIETSWATWRQQFPNSVVMNTNTSYNRSYDRYPYGDYRTNHSLLLFPVSPEDDRLPRKDRGLGVILDGKARFYPLKRFSGQRPVLVQESFNGIPLVIAGNRADNYLVAYERRLQDGTLLEFTSAEGPDGIIMEDGEGNQWDLFGVAVSGPRAGQRLRATESYMGFWFAWAAFYPNLSIY